MAVKEGYKQTEVGIVPEAWNLATLSEVCILSKRKHTPRNSKDNYRCIELEHVEQNTGRLLDYTESQKQLSQKSYFYVGSVLFGKLRPYLRKYYYAGFDGVCSTEMWVLLSNENIESKYLYYLFQSDSVIEACNKSVGTKMPRADWNIVNNTIVTIPPLPEQKAIATALSDIDGLINSLTKLIEKKKNIKQGAMQELLTGKKRLDGFSGEWKNVILKDIIINFIVPMRDKPKNLKGNIPWCRIEDFEGKYLSKSKSGQGVSKETIASMNLKVFPVGTLLVSCSAYLGRCAIVADELVTNQTFIGLLPSIKINVEYLYYVMRREEIKLNELSSGTTISYLSRSHFENYQISIPDIEEQNAIASVFLDIDLEVECLQSKLNKYKAIKQGLMQELLTGRIRLLEGA